jgi:anti-sigma B factor antagonist
MPRIMPMPPESEPPDGPHRDCAVELRRCCRAAGCPALRQVSRAAGSREDLRASQPGAFCQHPGRASGPVLAIGVRRGAGHVLVTVAGEVDIATVPRLREQLFALAAGGRPLIADLDRVSFIDAAGLGVLAGAAGRAAAHGGSLHVVCARDRTRRLLRLTGLDRPAGLAGTVGEALQRLAAGPGTRARAEQDSRAGRPVAPPSGCPAAPSPPARAGETHCRPS